MGAVTVLVGSFLPWLRSGTRDRSSYDLLAIVDRLGFAPGGVVGWAVRLWPALPLLLVVVVIVHWWPAGHGRRTVTLVTAAYSAGTATAILLAPEVALFSVGPGPWLAIVGAVGLVAAAVLSRGSAAPAAS